MGEIPIRIKLEKMDPRVIPDLTGSAEIVLRARSAIPWWLLVPRYLRKSGSYVFVQGPEGWIKKKVELGLPSFTQVSIRSGVQKGDVLALQRPM